MALANADYSKARDVLKQAGEILAQPSKYDIRRLNYDTFGAAYTAWLTAVVAFAERPQSPLTDKTGNQLQVIPEYSQDKATSVYRFLKKLESTGHTVEEDIICLLRMAENGFLD